MKKLMLLLCLVPFFVAATCNHRLEPGGAYAPTGTNTAGQVIATQNPDVAFFTVDAAYDLAYSAADTAFSFEKRNRDMLWKVSPSIKKSLDKIRPQADAVRIAYAKARFEYKSNPTPAGLSNLQTILSQMKSLSAAATAALPQPK